MATYKSPRSYFSFKLPTLQTKEVPTVPDLKIQLVTPVTATATGDEKNGEVVEQLKVPVPEKTEGDDAVRRNFPFRRSKSTSKVPIIKKSEPMPPIHERGASFTIGETHKRSEMLGTPTHGLQRSKSKREKVAHAIANPEGMFTRDPQSPPPESKFNVNPNSKFARTFFGAGVDFGSGVPQGPLTPPTPLPDLEAPLFNQAFISNKVATELQYGHSIRPLCRSDYNRGFMDLLGILGPTGSVSEEAWEERCSWLETMGSTYFILVITAPDFNGKGERVIASGTVFFERKFTRDMCTVGHIEDIAVARDQKGRKMGLRVLEALVFAAQTKGCCKTLVNCTEGNEAFHAQCDFSKEGTQMVLHHPKK